MSEEKRVKTKIKPDICPLCKKPTEVAGIGVYECNTCKNKWFEEGLILEERYVEAYGKSEELLAKLQEKDKEVKKEEVKKEEKREKFKRPERLEGSTREIESGCGNLFLTLNHTEDKRIVEVLLLSNPAGGCGSAFLNTVGITLSFYLQEGGDVRRYIRKLAGTRCPRSRSSAKSCPEAIVQVLKEEMSYLKGDKSVIKEREEKDDKEIILVRGETCPDCNNLLIMQEGCKVCKSCGWSECS